MNFDLRKFHSSRTAPAGAELAVGTEKAADYDALRQSLYQEHQPQTETEAMLVESIAQNWWRLQRAQRCEQQMLERAALEGPDILFSPSMKYFVRFRNGIERAWKSARKDLAQMQARRLRAAKAQPAQPETPVAVPPPPRDNPVAEQLPSYDRTAIAAGGKIPVFR